MWPSTCASSVLSRLKKKMIRPATITKTAAPPEISNLRSFAFGFGAVISSSRRSSSVFGFTFVAFSSPTSISMLIPVSSLREFPLFLLRVNFFHLADSSRIIRTRLIESVERHNLVIIRSCQGVLGLDHFNVVRHARLEAVARLINLFFRQLNPQIRYLHFVPPRLQIQQRRLHVQRNRIAQVRFLFVQYFQLKIRLHHFRVNSSAGKERHHDSRLIRVNRNSRRRANSLIRPVPVKPQ